MIIAKNNMNKRLIPFLAIGLFASMAIVGCSGHSEEGPEAIRQQITAYQAQINEITLKVNELERELERMGERPMSRNQLPVSVLEADLTTFEQYFNATSTVEAVQAAIISPETSGQIKEILVEKGQQVNAGQVVARLNTSVVENSIEELRTSLSLANTVYQRQKGLWDLKIGSEIQYLEAKNAVESLENRLNTLESQLQMAVMRAPFTGLVDEIFLKSGELAMPGMGVMNLVNLKRVYINADISETYLGSIQKGDLVKLRIPSYPDLVMEVPVHRIGNVINPENRTFRVQLLIDNPSGLFKPNMMAMMGITTKRIDDALVIPSILIRQDLQGHYVYIAGSNNGDQVAIKKYIERGPDGEGNTMVLKGIEPGDLIISRGNNQVVDGSLIRIEEQGSSALTIR